MATKLSQPKARFVSVGWKLAGSTVAVIAVLAVSAQVVISRFERKSLMASKQHAADMLIQLSAAGLSAPLAFSDDKGVEEQVNLLAANDEVVYGAAWPIEMDAPGHLGHRLGELKRGDATIARPDHIPLTIERRFGEYLIEEAPVLDPNGKTIGVVAIAFSLEKEEEALAAAEKSTFLLSLAAATLLAGVLLLIARRSIVNPLRSLSQAAKLLERGESATIEARANDEIGQLAQALRAMSEAIVDRELSLSVRNRDMRLILDNAGEGFITVHADGVLSDERSRMLDEWFSPPPDRSTLFEYMEQIAGVDTAEWMRLGWESLGILPTDVAIEQLPKKFSSGERFFAVEYRPIPEGDSEEFTAMLVVVRDMTAEVERRRSEEMQKEALSLFQHFLKDRNGFSEFFNECRTLVGSIQEDEPDEVTVSRNIHTLKGNAGLFGLDSIARYCHELESRLNDEYNRPTANDVAMLSTAWHRIEEMAGRLGADDEARITIDPREHGTLLEAIRSAVPYSELETMVSALAYEPAARRLATIGEQVKALGERFGKPQIHVDVKPTPLRLPPRRWAKFWPALVHILRNAVDHGLETPSEREKLGKQGTGNITLSLERIGQEIVFSFGDDGRGIPWDTLAEKASRLGLDISNRQNLEDVIYIDRVSSADEITEVSGRGVGMSAVKAAVQALGGRISISSDEGKGTTVRFSFPGSMLREDAA